MDEHQRIFDDHVSVIQDRAPRLISAAANHPDTYADIFYELTHRQTHYRVDHKSSPSRLITRSQANTIEGLGIRHLLEDDHLHWVSDGWAPASWVDGAKQTRATSHSDETAHLHTLIASKPLAHDAPEYISKAEKKQFIASVADTILGYDTAITQCSIEYQDMTRRTLLINSAGRAIQQQSAWAGVRVRVSLNINQQLYTAYLTQGYQDQFDKLFLGGETQLVTEVVGRAHQLAEAVTAPSGPQSVVFAGGWGGIWLHEVLGHALEGDTFNANPMHQRLDTDIASHNITITDDPTLAGAHGSYDFDDEGTPAQRTVLVDGGRLCQLLTDRYTAKLNGYHHTGNGRRQDYRHLPLPRMTNLCLKGGTASPEDLISNIKSGIYVDHIKGGRFFEDTDRFELDVAGAQRIEKGRLTNPLKPFRLAGKCNELLWTINGIARDVQPDIGTGQCKKHGQIVPVSVYAPTVWIETLDAIPLPTLPFDMP